MRTAIVCFALALTLMPHLASARTIASRNGETRSNIRQSWFALASGTSFAPIITSELRQRESASDARGARNAETGRFADDAVRYIEGPSWDYRMSLHGPMFEVGALGGGMENAPYLAHVAMDWRF